MIRVLASSLLVCGLFASTGCGVGGCDNVYAPGIATILSVEPSGSGRSACPQDPVHVVFRFVPTDTTLAPTEMFDLTTPGGMDPARAWVTASGLTVGSAHRATRSIKISGGCPPMGLKLDDVDYVASAKTCR